MLSQHSFVELESGDQVYFDNSYDAFKYAKECEQEQKNSVAYVAISKNDINDYITLEEATKLSVYRGQQLRLMIRALDNTKTWIRTQLEEQKHAEEHEESADN